MMTKKIYMEQRGPDTEFKKKTVPCIKAETSVAFETSLTLQPPAGHSPGA